MSPTNNKKRKERRKEPKGTPNPSHNESPPRIGRGAIFASAVILCIAIAVSQWRNSTTKNSMTRPMTLTLEEMLARVQKTNSFQLSNETQRTLIATESIPPNTVLLEIPRELMIWDLDAVRDEFVRRELLPAVFGRDENEERRSSKDNESGVWTAGTDISSKRAAVLAAYLALLRNGLVSPSDEFPLHYSVANTLPTYQDFLEYHPILAFSDDDAKEKLKHYIGDHSPTFSYLLQLHNNLNAEYDSFCRPSQKFKDSVSREDYLSSRLSVQSRAFQISKIPRSEFRTQTEFNSYQQNLQTDFLKGVISIEPVMDIMNSHPNNNVKVGTFDSESRVGRAWSVKKIGKGEELVNSYGKFYDFGLFGQYGFVNMDGTGTTIGMMFPHHHVDLMGDVAMGDGNRIEERRTASDVEYHDRLPSSREMVQYLLYDYGYTECIEPEKHPEAFKLKQLKLSYLQLIGTDASRWLVPLPPRSNSDVTPPSTTAIPNNYVLPSFDDSIYEYLETHALDASLPCRLIALTHRDLDDAVLLLQDDLKTLEQALSSSAGIATALLRLEELQITIPWMVRTLHCMRKLASTQKQKYGVSLEDQKKYILNMVQTANGRANAAADNESSVGNHLVNTLEWNAAHIVLGEIQSQEVLENWGTDVLLTILDMMADAEGEERLSVEDTFVREEPCPESLSIELVSNFDVQ